ncbi:hypothetical protein IC619_002500 [Hazenella sp. IB182353]|uniref:hypothetical protein n=1 Tax=Polycladospora coralii TaxID=2771432 RepID=UPI0017465E2E|nr:hypothetical protein [Polycladospora coralii]MBS7529366.1 hypothetical protein [Polycladospora coralii]
MSEKNQLKNGIHSQIEGNVGGSILIGDFSNNKGAINSNNQIHQTRQEDQFSVEDFKELAKEFYELVERNNNISREEKEDSIELMQLNVQQIESGDPKRSIMKSLMQHLQQLKYKLNDNCPLLINIGALTQVLSFFLPK